MPTELLYQTDSYLRDFDSTIVDGDGDAHAVACAETAFFPTGGGQPHDLGTLTVDGRTIDVVEVAKGGDGQVWHTLGADTELPPAGARAHGVIDWDRRYALMRVHSGQHVLNGVIWNEYGAHVTGASMTPGEGRLDFELPSMSQEFACSIEAAVNEQIVRDLEVRVLFLPRSEADHDPSLMRLKANLIPRSVDPLRVIDIVGLDRQADGGTHVATTKEIGRIRVLEAKSKGKANKRIRIAVEDA